MEQKHFRRILRSFKYIKAVPIQTTKVRRLSTSNVAAIKAKYMRYTAPFFKIYKRLSQKSLDFF